MVLTMKQVAFAVSIDRFTDLSNCLIARMINSILPWRKIVLTHSKANQCIYIRSHKTEKAIYVDGRFNCRRS